MQKYQNNILTTNGTPAVGASVTVLNYPSLTTATIYSSVTGTAVANPLITNSSGYFSFYAANGHYTLSVTGINLMSTQFTDIILDDNINTAGTIALGAGSTCGVNTTAVVGGTYPEQLQAVRVPANTLGINGQMDIQFSVSAGSSASNKDFFVYLNGIQIGPTFILTTQVSTTGTIRVRNSGALNSQIVSVLTTDGQSTSSFQTMAVDTTKDVLIKFVGSSGGTGGDSITLSGYNVTYYNPPVVPTPPSLIPGSKLFWGVNSHPGYVPTVTGANHVQIMQFMGCGLLRLDWEGTSSASGIEAIATAFQGTGLQLCIVNGQIGMNSATNVAYASEGAAYTAAFNSSYTMASTLIPYGITLFEAGNEMDAGNYGSTMVLNPANQGTYTPDYGTTAFFPVFRGAHNGSIDGIRKAGLDAGVSVLVASNAFTEAAIWITDGLWTGTDPFTGTTGGAISQWDITNWHTYGNGTMLGPATQYTGGGGAPHFNLLAYLANAYGRPIFISEYNPSASTGSSNATQTVAWMTAWLGVQAQYNIASVMFYDLFDSAGAGASGWNMYISDAGPFNNVSNLNTTGVAFQSFTNSNPAPR